ALADRDRVLDPAVVERFLRVVTRTKHAPRSPQVGQKPLLQGTAGLDVEGAVDRLGGHLAARVVRIGALEPQPETCSGDHCRWSLLATCRAKTRCRLSLQGLGRRARSQALWSA